MTWRTANSLLQLRKQIDEFSPDRSRVSDGTIGNTEHAARNSDHNPWVKNGYSGGIVTALDITNDPAHNVVSDDIANALIASKDGRIKYIISKGFITSGSEGLSPWVKRKYDGKNPHNHHFHISVKPQKEYYDSVRSWRLMFAIETPPPEEERACPMAYPVLSRGAKGDYVGTLQRLLIEQGHRLIADSVFGFKTEDAVKVFQKKNGMVADGIVGPYTWEKLLM